MTGDLPLPTFFVIGAPKAGTTSLHFYFDAHPAIEMTDPKEPHLMIGPGWRARLHGYEALFSGSAVIRGEASPGYAVMPRNSDAPENIAAVVPDARIVYMVRDPVPRAIAQYAQHVILGMEQRPIEEALDVNDPLCEYVAASRYGTVLEGYLAAFGREQVLVVDQAELRSDRRNALARLYAHVGADPGFWNPESLERDYNVRSVDNRMLPGRLKQARYGRLNALSKRILPPGLRSSLVGAVRGALGREVAPDVPGELEERLRDALAPEAEKLRGLTGASFDDWSV